MTRPTAQQRRTKLLATFVGRDVNGDTLDDRIRDRLHSISIDIESGMAAVARVIGGLLLLALILAGLGIGLVIVLAVIKWAFGVVF